MSRLKKVQDVPLEETEQIALIIWLKNQRIRVSGSANGGKRNLWEAMKLKRMGVSPGFPDIEIPLPSGGYHGLYIEMKRVKGGRLSAEQLDWLDYLRDKGYMAEVAHGFEEAKAIVLRYLSLMKPAA